MDALSIRNTRGETYSVSPEGMLRDGVLIKIDLDDAIDRDLEEFLDMISDDAGFPLLMQPEWEIEGFERPSTLLLRVRGDISAHTESSDESL